MKKWFLSTYFEEIAIKRLSSVESNLEKSNQHEINGVTALIKMFWKAEMDKKVIPATFLYVSDSEGSFESIDGELTRYDSRAKHPTRTEHRLYYPRNNVTEKIAENDVLIIAKQPTWNVLFLCVQSESFPRRDRYSNKWCRWNGLGKNDQRILRRISIYKIFFKVC